jgi:hypothetical protein
VRLVCSHFKTPLGYVNEEMPFGDWWPCLVAALEAEDIEQMRHYQGKAEDYVGDETR